MHLVPNLPKDGFEAGPNMKRYIGSLQQPLLDILDQDSFQQVPGQIIADPISQTKHITFVRHLESKYNEYKTAIKTNPDYQEFMTTTDRAKKKELVSVLLQDFFDTVGIDYETKLSQAGEQQGEYISQIYAELIGQNPQLFPELICVSPYVRTRKTAHYFLKNISGLDINLDQLIDEDQLQDLIVGSYQGKNITIKIDERIRERDHGSNIAPNFIRDFLEEDRGFHSLLTKEQKEKIYYYTSPMGGESQNQTNARTKEFLLRHYGKHKPENIRAFSHHLIGIGALLSIFGGSFHTFYKINELRKPANGSLTILSQIPKTETGQEDKFRVAAYNLSLQK